MTTITEQFEAPGGLIPPDMTTIVDLWGLDETHGFDLSAGKTIGGPTLVEGNPWTLTGVTGNADIDDPANTVYRVKRRWSGGGKAKVDYVTVPTTAGPYDIGDILTQPPGALTPSGLAAHAADTALHGGGQRIFAANVSANFTTASTSFVDLPGATATFTVPDRPFAVFAQIPVFVEEANQGGDLQLLAGSTVVTAAAIPRQSIAGPSNTMAFGSQAPLPVWNPTPGSNVTVKVQMKSSVATSDLTVFVDFGGPLATCQIWGMTV